MNARQPWQDWADMLRRTEPDLVAEWFNLAEAAWSLGIRQTSSDLLLHQARFRLRRPVLNHTACVLARMWREANPARASLFMYRPSRLDGDTGDDGQPDLFGVAA